jgi:hypothetical protein
MFREKRRRGFHDLAQASGALQCVDRLPGLGKIEWSRSSQCCPGLPLSPALRSRLRAVRGQWRVLSSSIVCCDTLSSSRRIDWVVSSARPRRLSGKSGTSDRVADQPHPIRGRGRQSRDWLCWVVRGVPLLRSAVRDQLGAGMLPDRGGHWPHPRHHHRR